MPKMGSTDNLRFMKKPLSQLIKKKNTRQYFNQAGIEELAGSIEKRGQKQPIIVNSKGEIEAGYRRVAAFEFLCSQGKDYSMIECIIDNDNFLLTNLTENIHREDLTGKDLEEAISRFMKEEDLSQRETAKALGKTEQWISDVLAAGKTRQRLDGMGINTETFSSSTLSVLRALTDDQLRPAAAEVEQAGGTVKAAKKAATQAKKKDSPVSSDPFKKVNREINALIIMGMEKGKIQEHVISLLEDN